MESTEERKNASHLPMLSAQFMRKVKFVLEYFGFSYEIFTTKYGVEVMRLLLLLLLLIRGSICSELYDLAAREYALHVRNRRAAILYIYVCNNANSRQYGRI